MKQVDILKSILTEYVQSGGDPANIHLALAYVESHKPAEVGRVTEVILRALLKGIPRPVAAPEFTVPIGIAEHVTVTVNTPSNIQPEARRENIPYPLPIVDEPTVIAKKTVMLPEVMKDKPVAVYRETADPVTHVNAPFLPSEPVEPPKKKRRSLFQRLRDAINQLAGDD